MDYSEICQGWIYSITNKINGRMYIGQTKDYERRKREHFVYESCYRLVQAFEKYGIDNFEMCPIICITAINETVRAIVLDELEKFYIKRYNTHLEGYNSTDGGRGLAGCDFSQETRHKLSKIMSDRMAQGTLLFEKLKEVKYKPILQYDLNGMFLKEFSSISDAVAFLNNSITLSAISQNLKGKNKSAGGYMWRYKEEDNYPLHIEALNRKKEKAVYLYNKDGFLIARYENTKIAAKVQGVNPHSITSSIYYGKMGRVRTDNYWSYDAPAA